VEVPARWNGTLVLYSHGYYPHGFAPEQIAVATRAETEAWLLDHGYALAASNFKGKFGFAVEDALADQIALLDWFSATVGRPARTISSGMSMGGGIAIILSERHPRRFDGVLAQCSEYDLNGTWNSSLDINFVIKALLAPDADIDLVKPRDPVASRDALLAVIAEAQATPQGRARLALAGAVANIPAWSTAHLPEPTTLADRLAQQAAWVSGAYVWGTGPTGRADLEPRVGGNPSWNVGVDYRRLLAHSAVKDLAVAAYREDGVEVDLQTDLDRLAATPRIAPDPHALADMYRFAVARGTTPAPVLTMHNTGDGGAVADQVRWYAEQVRRHGNPDQLRQTYVDRGGHCAFSAAEEIVALKTLEARVATGRWPDTHPDRLNAAAGAFGPEYHLVLDLFTFEDEPMPPAFARFTPARFLRPSR
jgi:hypothetical protein